MAAIFPWEKDALYMGKLKPSACKNESTMNMTSNKLYSSTHGCKKIILTEGGRFHISKDDLADYRKKSLHVCIAELFTLQCSAVVEITGIVRATCRD